MAWWNCNSGQVWLNKLRHVLCIDKQEVRNIKIDWGRSIFIFIKNHPTPGADRVGWLLLYIYIEKAKQNKKTQNTRLKTQNNTRQNKTKKQKNTNPIKTKQNKTKKLKNKTKQNQKQKQNKNKTNQNKTENRQDKTISWRYMFLVPTKCLLKALFFKLT